MKRKLDFGKKLSKVELKEVKGGGCAWDSGTDRGCFSGAVEAEFMAGASGWWCCNCAGASHC